MYMNISLFGFKLDFEILILIGIIYLIMVIHTMCGCCNMQKIKDAFTNPRKAVKGLTKDLTKDVQNAIKIASENAQKTVATAGKTAQKTVETVENFVGANTNYGESSDYDLRSDIPVDTTSWSMPSLSVISGQPLSQGVQQILNRETQPVPLPEGEMLMFANTPFKPECCPNTFSNSSGCACMTTGQYNYLILRGGNNTPYSEY